jgi:type IV pilus assembly protein PilW
MLIRALRRRGLSVVELMVGVAVGLAVVAGALSLMARNLAGSRHLLAETRLNQDLRAAVDVVARDLRRAGFWGNAVQGTIAVANGATAVQNPYGAVSSSADSLGYGFSRDTVENNVLDDQEQYGFRLRNGVLQMQTESGLWQDLTDGGNMTVTVFAVSPILTTLALGKLCPKTCAAGTPNCPTTTVRSFDITLAGRSARDASLLRSLDATVLVRNHLLSGQCPS